MVLQIAEQMSDYLLTGAVINALNMPSVTAEEAKVMGPWLKLAGHLGSFIGQMTDEPVKAINILYDGSVSSMNLEALNCSVIAGIMKKANPDVNLVSAPFIAKERGIQISTTNQDKSGAFDGYIKVTVVTAERERSIAEPSLAMENRGLSKSKGLISMQRLGSICSTPQTKTCQA